MPKRQLEEDTDEVSYEGTSSAPSHSARYRVHYYPGFGPLYIGNFSNRSVFGSSTTSRKSSLQDPKVYQEKKQIRTTFTAGFGLSKTAEPPKAVTARITSSLVDHGERALEPLEYSGTNKNISTVEQHRKLYVAFMNKKTRKMHVLPASMVFMRPTSNIPEEDTEETNKTEENTKEAERQRVQDLTFAFGSHKKQQALRSANERRSLAADAINTAIETAMIDAKSKKSEKLVGEPGVTTEDIAVIEANKPTDEFDLGPPNMKATTPTDIFPVEQIVPKVMLSQISPVDVENSADLPVLVKKCLSGSKTPEESDLKLLNYLKILILMHKSRGLKVKKGDCVPRNLPANVRNMIFSRFMVTLESTMDATNWSMPPRLKTRLLVHIMMIAMHALSKSGNSFGVNMADLQADLALAPRTLGSVARQFGCNVSGASSGTNGMQVINLHCPYKPPPPPTMSRGVRRGR